MEKILDVQEIITTMREDERQLEKLIADLKKEEKAFYTTSSDTP